MRNRYFCFAHSKSCSRIYASHAKTTKEVSCTWKTVDSCLGDVDDA